MIKSLKGGPCNVVNPWKEKTIKVKDLTKGKKIKVLLRQNELEFNTKEGHSYILERKCTP